MNNNCFVIMPYGKKKDIDGNEVDFDDVYQSIIAEAVNRVDGLKCVRCDDIEKPGWIHERMLRHIFEDRVAVVDTSTLNANVFYELGVRHALKESVTVLIRKAGTSSPFNIAGLTMIEYSTAAEGREPAIEKIRTFIVNALNDPEGDSLVYKTIPGLRVQRKPTPITKVTITEYPLRSNAAQKIAFVTGDREDITVGDIWVTSENTKMQMDSYYGKSTSATIRYLGAKKNAAGKVVEDTIGDELAQVRGDEPEVEPASVLVTGAGSLTQSNNVKWIFHVAAVEPTPREGYRTVARIDQCVKNALRRATSPDYRAAASILFPIFGTGPAGGDFLTHAEICVDAAVEHLESFPEKNINKVYFFCWSDVDLDTCQMIARNHPGLQSA